MYFFSKAISDIGDIAHLIAIMSILIKYDTSISIISFIIGINAVVRLITSMFLLKRVDKLNPKKVMIILNNAYGFFMFALVILLIIQFELIYFILFEIIFSFIFTFNKIVRDKVLNNVIFSEKKTNVFH